MTMQTRLRSTRGHGKLSLRSSLTWMSVAILGGLITGCVLPNRQPESSSAPAQPATTTTPANSQSTQEDIPTTASVDLGRTVGENITFHQNATDRQRFQVHLDFGRVFENQGNLDQAIKEYQDALSTVETKRHAGFKATDQALAHRRLAAAYDRRGRFTQAEEHYNKALKLSPKDARIWNDAGYSYYLQGRWAEAEPALKMAMKLAPDDSRIRTNLGLLLAASGRFEEALPFLSRTEGDAVGHANLGYLLASTGQFEQARKEYGKALAMRPDLVLAKRALAQLDKQQHGVLATSKSTQIAQTRTRPLDPGVTTASTSTADNTILPQIPTSQPIPYPKLPSRTLP